MSQLSNLLLPIPLSSLKFSNLYTIPCSFYVSPNEQNQMCELCMFSQIQSHIFLLNVQEALMFYVID